MPPIRIPLVFAVLLLAFAGHFLPAAPVEFTVRGGLPNVQAKLVAGQEVRIAFLGGSITAANGWRPLALRWFGEQYPRARVVEIFAAVSGTNSGFGAARLERDVLRHKPDLLFVEFAVNDGVESDRVVAQMEGIVRKTLTANPSTDICFVYTVSSGHLKDLADGRYQGSARSMERVAEHYGIPALNFGIEVTSRLAQGTLVFHAPGAVRADEAGNDPQGRLIFTRDNTHPTDAGHRLYAARLALALPEFFRAGKPGPRTLPDELTPDNWQRARIHPVADCGPDARWSAIPADLVPEKMMQPALLLPGLRSFEPGASVEFRFRGTRLGVVGLKGPDNGQFRVTVDGKLSETGTLFDSFSVPGRYYPKVWFFPSELEDTEHHVRLELLADRIDKASVMQRGGNPVTDPAPFEPHGIYLSGFLLVGEVVAAPDGAVSH